MSNKTIGRIIYITVVIILIILLLNGCATTTATEKLTTTPNTITTINAAQEIYCPSADCTGDCRVDLRDYKVMVSQWLLCIPEQECSSSADVNGDCYVGIADLMILTSQWLTGVSGESDYIGRILKDGVHHVILTGERGEVVYDNTQECRDQAQVEGAVITTVLPHRLDIYFMWTDK